MSELHEIDGIVFGGERYTVGVAGEVPEGLIDPTAIEWLGNGGFSGGILRGISPVSIPVKLPDIDSGGNYITAIDSYNFRDTARALTGVILPSHLVEVPGSLFDGGKLEFVEFGSHLTSIGSSAFENNQITSVVLPDSLTSIGSSAFRNNQLTSVVIPDSVTSIESNVFRNNQLTSVVIPDSVTSIGGRAFDENPLKEVSMHIRTISESSSFPSGAVISLRIPEGWNFGEGLTSITQSAYSDMGLTGEITIADSITSIGRYAFRNNQLTSVDFPDSLTRIREQAFRNNQLTSVVIPDSVTSIESNVFENNQITSVVLPDSLTSIPVSTFQNNQLTSVVIPDSVTSIGNSAFRDNQLTSVVLPDSLTSIGSGAFGGNQITSVHTGGISGIPSGVFSGSPIEKATIGSKFSEIVDYTNIFGSFESHRGVLKELTIEGELNDAKIRVANVYKGILEKLTLDDATEVKPDSFNEFNLLIDVYLGPETIYYEDSFVSKADLTIHGGILGGMPTPEPTPEPEPEPEGQIFGEGQTSIGGYRDKGITGAITIADGVTSIGSSAFRENQITSVVIPDSLTSIGSSAFDNNPLEEVSIGPNTTYGTSTFPYGAVITVRD